jgi:hypothetical protein
VRGDRARPLPLSLRVRSLKAILAKLDPRPPVDTLPAPKPPGEPSMVTAPTPSCPIYEMPWPATARASVRPRSMSNAESAIRSLRRSVRTRPCRRPLARLDEERAAHAAASPEAVVVPGGWLVMGRLLVPPARRARSSAPDAAGSDLRAPNRPGSSAAATTKADAASARAARVGRRIAHSLQYSSPRTRETPAGIVAPGGALSAACIYGAPGGRAVQVCLGP